MAKKKSVKRQERRFHPRSTAPVAAVSLVGAVGAALLGAGTWGAMIRPSTPVGEALSYGWWLLAGGSLLLGGAVWFGTSGEPAVRVGHGGIAVERNGLWRMPWYGVKSIALDGTTQLRIEGEDESGSPRTLVLRVGSHPQAIAWIVREARERVPGTVALSDEASSAIPEALAEAGELLPLDAPQIVGRRCAASGGILAFEPDARLCPRCERVYGKNSVPIECACGASLKELQQARG